MHATRVLLPRPNPRFATPWPTVFTFGDAIRAHNASVRSKPAPSGASPGRSASAPYCNPFVDGLGIERPRRAVENDAAMAHHRDARGQALRQRQALLDQ